MPKLIAQYFKSREQRSEACGPLLRRLGHRSTCASATTGCTAWVQTGLGRDPLSGELFLFGDQSSKLCKVLVWDGTGLCIFQKRLERGTFAKLWRDDGQVLRLTASELALFIEVLMINFVITEGG